MKTINEIAENYFNTLNPIAERISTDILAVKDAYEDLWHSLSDKERNQIINETVVYPEAVLKYTLNAKTPDANLDIPWQTKVVTSKYIVDENTGVSWRDEHSAPFSWMTPSQIDLRILTSVSQEVDGIDVTNKYAENKNFVSLSQTDHELSVPSENKNGWFNINEAKKNNLSPESNVVLVGHCSKLNSLCSKLKFLPGKSSSYEVQTVITNPALSSDATFLDRIKATAVLKLQNTLRLVSGKSSDKKPADSDNKFKDTENLVHLSGAVNIVKLAKTSPKISKPKSPPPPPPVLNNRGENGDNKMGKNFILAKTISNNKLYQGEMDLEKITLLESNSDKSFDDLDGLEREKSKVVHEISDDFNSISTECTPLSGATSGTDFIPKSGFDFLDNW